MWSALALSNVWTAFEVRGEAWNDSKIVGEQGGRSKDVETELCRLDTEADLHLVTSFVAEKHGTRKEDEGN